MRIYTNVEFHICGIPQLWNYTNADFHICDLSQLWKYAANKQFILLDWRLLFSGTLLLINIFKTEIPLENEETKEEMKKMKEKRTNSASE